MERLDLKETFFDTGEVRLRVMEGPAAGPPLVLLHGATAWWGEWMPVLPGLVDRWHVFALDLRGHGKSGRAAGVKGYHLSRYVYDTVTLLRQHVVEPAVLWGHSWGAMTALLSGEPGKESVRALVLEDPPLMLRRRHKEVDPAMNYFRNLYALKQSAPAEEALLAALREKNPQMPAAWLQQRAEVLHSVDPAFLEAILEKRKIVKGIDFEQAVEAIDCPILALQGNAALGAALLDVDLDFLRQHAKHTELVHFEDTGHLIHIEKPDEILTAFYAFAERLT